MVSAEKKNNSGSHTMPLDELRNNRGGQLCSAEISTSERKNASCLQPQGYAGTAVRLKSFDTSRPRTRILFLYCCALYLMVFLSLPRALIIATIVK